MQLQNICLFSAGLKNVKHLQKQSIRLMLNLHDITKRPTQPTEPQPLAKSSLILVYKIDAWIAYLYEVNGSMNKFTLRQFDFSPFTTNA